MGIHFYKRRRMALARGKIVKAHGEEPDEVEKQISQALLDLEVNSDLKAALRELHITAAKEVDCAGGKKAIVIFVPVPQQKAFQKIQARLVRELEKNPSQADQEGQQAEAEETQIPHPDGCSQFHPGRPRLPCRDCWKENQN